MIFFLRSIYLQPSSLLSRAWFSIMLVSIPVWITGIHISLTIFNCGIFLVTFAWPFFFRNMPIRPSGKRNFPPLHQILYSNKVTNRFPNGRWPCPSVRITSIICCPNDWCDMNSCNTWHTIAYLWPIYNISDLCKSRHMKHFDITRC